MGAEIRYWKSLAKQVAGGIPVTFVVTEADGSFNHKTAFRYHPKSDVPTDKVALVPMRLVHSRPASS
jgi:hypothetical protein